MMRWISRAAPLAAVSWIGLAACGEVGNVRPDVGFLPNDPPVATADTAMVTSNGIVVIDVLANDMDPDGDPIEVRDFTQAASGEVTRGDGARLIYAPAEGFDIGDDAFTYTIVDGRGGEATGTVNISVTPVNTAPAAADDVVETQQGEAIDILVLENDRDAEGDVLRVTEFDQGNDGTVELQGTDTLRYTPNDGFFGSDWFAYNIGDAPGLFGLAQVQVTINGRPAAADDTFTMGANMTMTFDVIANDSDPEGDTLMVTGVSMVQNGTAELGDDQDQREVRFTPTDDFSGMASFMYTLEDGRGGSATAAVNINVSFGPIVETDQVITLVDAPIDIDVAANDTDPEGGMLTVLGIATMPMNGTATVTPGNQVRYTPNAGYRGTDEFSYTIAGGRGATSIGLVQIIVNGPPVAGDDTEIGQQDMPVVVDVLVNDSDPDGDTLTVTASTDGTSGTTMLLQNTVMYTPNAGFAGMDSFTYSIADGQGGTATGQVMVRVNAPPVALDDAVIAQQDIQIRFDPRTNDSDTDGDPITILAIAAPSDGTATSTAGDVILFTPTAGFFGVNSFAYTISDGVGGTADGRIVVEVNAAPIAADDNFNIQQAATTLDVLANDLDPDMDALMLLNVTAPFGGTAVIGGAMNDMIIYTPGAGFFGLDNFMYTAVDARGGTVVGAVQLDVNAVPVVANDTFVIVQNTAADIDVLFNDDPVDADGFNFATISRGANGGIVAVNVDQTLNYTPAVGYVGPDSFTYVVEDGRGAMATGTVNITVVMRPVYNPVNATDQLTGIGDAFGLANADFDADGAIDSAVTNRGQDTVTVVLNATVLNDVNPLWIPRVEFAVGDGPEAVAAVDMNQDMAPDLIVANTAAGTVSVLLNDPPVGGGAAVFRAAANFASGATPNSLAIADLNADGRPDVVVGNGAADTVTVLMNQTGAMATNAVLAGANTFAAPSVRGLALADLNADGRPDIVATNQAGNAVSVLFNQTPANEGMPVFTAAATFAVGNNPFGVAIGDVNRDGSPDLAVANETADTVSILLNQTVATSTTPAFGAATAIGVGTAPSGVVLADLNAADGIDMAVTNGTDNTVSVLFNTTAAMAAAPTFTANMEFAMGGDAPRQIGTGDVNGDMVLDLIVVNAESETVAARVNGTAIGGAAPVFNAVGTERVGRSMPVDVEAADMTLDGNVDVVTLDRADQTVTILSNNTGALAPVASFFSAQVFDVGADLVDMALGDLNGDGLSDVAVINQAARTVTVRMNTTAASGLASTLGAATTVATGLTPVAIEIADVNRDTVPDLIVVQRGDDSVGVMLNQTAMGAGTATFAARTDIPVGQSPRSVFIGDLNGDNNPDLAVAAGNQNTASVVLNQTAMGGAAVTFSNVQNIATFGLTPAALAGIDINANGMLDLVVVHAGDGALSILPNNTMPGAATATFGQVFVFAPFIAGGQVQKIKTADVNGDGRVDMVVPTDGDDTVTIILNTTPTMGDNFSVVSLSQVAGGVEPNAVAIADLNRDGAPDLLVTTAQSDNLRVLTGP